MKSRGSEGSREQKQKEHEDQAQEKRGEQEHFTPTYARTAVPFNLNYVRTYSI